MRLLFLFLFISLNSHSQEVLIEDLGSLRSVGIDSIDNKLLLFYDGYYNKLDLKTLEIRKHIVFPDSLFSNLRRIYIKVDAEQFFVSGDGGLVYQLKNDSLQRIDNSFGHRMQHSSSIFAYDSRIYRYGGYGFWSARNFFIYFDKITREWEVNEKVNSKVIPDGTFTNQFILNKDDIYLFNGIKVDPNNRRKKFRNNEVWKYNFKDHKWTYLGSNSFMEGRGFIKYRSKILQITGNSISEIDIINNKITTYQHNLISPKMHTRFPSFYLDQNFYCFVTKRGLTSLKVMHEDEFLKNKLSNGVFYKNYPYWGWLFLKYFIIPILGLLGIWFGFRLYKKKQKIILLKNGLRFKNNYVEFDSESMIIIQLLLSKKEVASNQILSIVEKSQYSPAHNERVKVQKINDINIKIKAQLGITDNIVKSRKSEKDRRIKIFTISNEYFYKK